MKKQIIVNPLTRISGFAEIEVTVEDNIVVDAQTKGFIFRGFEKMLNGRKPFDAVYFTERICGICSTAHGTASTLALEDAMGIVPDEQGRFLRDLIHGCEFLQNHIRHFYQFTLPDFVKMPQIKPLYPTNHNDFRLPEKINMEIAQHYFESLEMGRLAHEMLAVLGGKAPHNHGIFVGGSVAPPTTDKKIKIRSILHKISEFIVEKMLPDVYTIAKYYKDYYHMGRGYGNLMSYGCFDDYKSLGTLYVNPLVSNDKTVRRFNPEGITEEIEYSWYDGTKSIYKPFEEIPDPDMNKEKAYSWVKAPRYEKLPYETGPLARQWLSGVYRKGISAMDRMIARVEEAKKISEVMDILLDNILIDVSVQKKYEIPEKAQGKGLIDTTRGSLGHWLKIDNSVISFYQIITPSAWNFSSRDEKYRGVAEQSLIGLIIANSEAPVEIGRVLRSFDPCISCAVHVYSPGHDMVTMQVIP